MFSINPVLKGHLKVKGQGRSPAKLPPATPQHIFLNNLGSNRDRNVIQVPNPMFLGMTNQLVAMNMTSRGRHIGFQDGHQQPTNGNFRR